MTSSFASLYSKYGPVSRTGISRSQLHSWQIYAGMHAHPKLLPVLQLHGPNIGNICESGSSNSDFCGSVLFLAVINF